MSSDRRTLAENFLHEVTLGVMAADDVLMDRMQPFIEQHFRCQKRVADLEKMELDRIAAARPVVAQTKSADIDAHRNIRDIQFFWMIVGFAPAVRPVLLAVGSSITPHNSLQHILSLISQINQLAQGPAGQPADIGERPNVPSACTLPQQTNVSQTNAPGISSTMGAPEDLQAVMDMANLWTVSQFFYWNATGSQEKNGSMWSQMFDMPAGPVEMPVASEEPNLTLDDIIDRA
ncbi:hypothetical protein AURDEDRAFT_131647 [Auricularia subglabra TFB-10046 SS5]|uniref:Uncharacterized protein n=1 Tax=Auricularia subglabra (strain TFB-10046 / SS5) TaxID=717982 RepID=J0D481_AURST|nr:hypothetical protein AURDEDRAFT_131647 [Auricularia subglabra TFB-10046 SS5]